MIECREQGVYDPGTVDFRILGPLEAAAAGRPLALGGTKQRAVLAMLLLHPGHLVTVDRLIEALWEDHPPASALGTLQSYVSQLRRALASGGLAGLPASRPGGYMLEAGAWRLDAARFEGLLEAGRLAADAGEPERAAATLRAALDLWRGDPLADFPDYAFAAGPRARLGELRLVALEARIEAELALGRHAGLVAELEELVAAQPLREGPRAQLMLALYRTGRQAEALSAYRDARDRLDEELGIEPGARLQRLEQGILRQDQQLDWRPPAAADPQAPPAPGASGGAEPAPLSGVPEVPALAPANGAPEVAALALPGPLPATAPGDGALSPPGEPSRAGGDAHNLPAELTSFVGREREVEEVRKLTRGTRMVTLTGPAGAGKTRLALRVAAEVAGAHPDGAWMVGLAPLAEPGPLPETVAAALGLQPERGRDLPDTIAAHLGARDLLLVLDNCEHLVAACAALVERLLLDCPRLRVLTTSREALRVPGELVWPVPPLSVPRPGGSATLEQLLGYESVRLFVERAQTARADFAPTEADATALVQVCARLDGIPLAIELAAARIGMLTPGQLAARLDDALRVLTAGSRTLPPRQQTLRAAVDWSHDLLASPERAVLRRLAVFAGEFTLESAEAVCAGDPVAAGDVLDLVGQLIDKSLVTPVDRSGQRRYRLLETMRQYGRERLEQAGETARARSRHAAFHLALALDAEPRLRGGELRAWLDRLEAEHDNLRAAVAWLGESGDSADELRMAAALWRYCSLRGHYREGRVWLERALDHSPELTGADPATRSAIAAAMHGAGKLAFLECDYPRATTLCEQSVEAFEQLGDKRHTALARAALAAIAREQADYPRANELLEQVIAALRALGDTSGVARALDAAGFCAWLQGDYRRAGGLLEESVALLQVAGEGKEVPQVLLGLGAVAHYQGDQEQAARLLERSLEHAQEYGIKESIAWSLNLLGLVEHRRGALGRASGLLEQSLVYQRGLGDRWRVASVLEAIAGIRCDQGQSGRPVRLLAAAAALRVEIGTPVPACERPAHEHWRSALQERMGADAFARAWREGRTLTIRQAVADATG